MIMNIGHDRVKYSMEDCGEKARLRRDIERGRERQSVAANKRWHQ
jgi:hypothetical protein